MGRLIDEDELIKRLEKSHEYHAKTSREEVLLFRDIRIVEEQPIAYDPDKVVERLEDYLFEKHCVEGDSEIERIVKGGGVDG